MDTTTLLREAVQGKTVYVRGTLWHRPNMHVSHWENKIVWSRPEHAPLHLGRDSWWQAVRNTSGRLGLRTFSIGGRVD